MNTDDNCVGKELVNKATDAIQQKEDECVKLMDEFYRKLCDDLCCVKIQEIERYGFLWLKARVIYKKILIKRQSMRFVGEIENTEWIYVSFEPGDVAGEYYSNSI